MFEHAGKLVPVVPLMANIPGENIHSSGKFRDRRQAGQLLARLLAHLQGEAPIVLALPRGGVPVAAEVAMALQAPLDIVVVRKLGAPFQKELGVGALVWLDRPEVVWNHALLHELGLTVAQMQGEVEAQEREARRRLGLYQTQWPGFARTPRGEARGGTQSDRREWAVPPRSCRGDRPALDLKGRTVILVDDGLATGITALAALQALRRTQPARLVLAIPVAPPDTLTRLADAADETVCLMQPPWFSAVGQFYDDFEQTSDEEVVALLRPFRP